MPYYSYWNQFQKPAFSVSSARFGVGGARSALGRHVKDRHVKDAAQGVVGGVVGGVPQDVAQEMAFGARVLAQLALRWERNWAAQWHLARAVRKRFRGCRTNHLYVYK